MTCSFEGSLGIQFELKSLDGVMLVGYLGFGLENSWQDLLTDYSHQILEPLNDEDL